jgi:hypothetical protein
MFYDKPECTKIVDGIYIFKNIIPKELVEKVNNELKSKDEIIINYEDARINWYKDKISPPIDSILEIWEFISEILYPEYVIHPQKNLIVTRPGDGGMFCHADSPGKGCEMHLTQIDTWQTCCIIDYGVIGYFGEFTGGAVFYPNFNKDGSRKDGEEDQNDCLEVFPQPGDIVVHGSTYPWNHGVREVESGIRYAFSNFSLKAVENPGSFYNYKSPEYYEILGNRDKDAVSKWGTPLMHNPQFFEEDGTVKPYIKADE